MVDSQSAALLGSFLYRCSNSASVNMGKLLCRQGSTHPDTGRTVNFTHVSRYGFDVVKKFLDGARAMDVHFKDAPMEKMLGRRGRGEEWTQMNR